MSVKKIKITLEQYKRCMKCEWRNKSVDGVIACLKIKCVKDNANG